MKTYAPVMQAMRQELQLQAGFLADKKLTSVYFGGGTPSLLKEEDLRDFLEIIHREFEVSPNAEITLEANPDDITAAHLHTFAQAGINRLSIGTQSFLDADLVLMNRAHNASMADASIKRAQDAGFSNITIDLMYGMPNSTVATWQQNVEKAIELNVPHISAYALTLESKTALAKMVAKKTVILPDEDIVANQYLSLCKQLSARGFEHYELSNFGKPGFFSAHNSAYWSGIPYLGIGPGAHSYNGDGRFFNVANNSIYAQKINAGLPWYEFEKSTPQSRYNEFIMTGLRTAKGISYTTLATNFGVEKVAQLTKDAAAYLTSGQLILKDDTLRIPEIHWLVSDRIISDLFWV